MEWDLKDRTKKFSLSIIDLVEKMDYSISKKVVMNQLVRAATSVGANSGQQSEQEVIGNLFRN